MRLAAKDGGFGSVGLAYWLSFFDVIILSFAVFFIVSLVLAAPSSFSSAFPSFSFSKTFICDKSTCCSNISLINVPNFKRWNIVQKKKREKNRERKGKSRKGIGQQGGKGKGKEKEESEDDYEIVNSLDLGREGCDYGKMVE